MNLILFNLKTDADDPILGFTTTWINSLAKHFENIDVITMQKGKVLVADNVSVYSVGKEKGYSKARRVLEFYRQLLCILNAKKIDACFSHMIHNFTILAAPILKAKKIPIVTWYAHPKNTWVLKLAHFLSYRMVTSLIDAYPYRRDKLNVIGQSIDMDMFSPNTTSSVSLTMILCVGRLSPVKDHPTLLKAASILKKRLKKTFSVVIVGGPGSKVDVTYINRLKKMVEELDVVDIVRFIPPVSLIQLPPLYNECTVHVNMSPLGFGDKVALESMACGKPCVAANEGFRNTFGKYADNLLFKFGDPYSLSQCLWKILSMKEENRRNIGTYLRDQVAIMHNKDDLGKKLKDVFAHYNIDKNKNRF